MSLISAQMEELFNSSKDEISKTLLSGIVNLNLMSDISEKHIISAINKLISVSKTRLQGLELLNLIINNCSSAVISENAISWISYCLIKYPDDSLKEVKLSTIGKIVEISNNEQDFTKKFISDCVSKVLENCLSTHINSYEAGAALHTLAVCMKYYGSWFTPHKAKIETFLISLLENTSEVVVGEAALAFHYLQQVGGAGTDGINHKNNFSLSFHKLCATIQKLFDILFENETEIFEYSNLDVEGFEFNVLQHHSQKMLNITSQRIRNCLKFLETLMLKGFPVAKEINPKVILSIINRGTSLHHCICTGTEKAMKDFQYSLLLNAIQIQILHLLRVFIIWLGANLLPYSFVINKIMIDCLKKSQNCQCFKADSIYQEKVYRAIGCWLRISRSSMNAHFQKELIKCIMTDAQPQHTQVTLTLNSDTSKSKSTKAKQKAIEERIISSGRDNASSRRLTDTDKFNREKNCLFALETLKHMLITTKLKLEQSLLQELYSFIITTVKHIQTSNLNESFIKHPYTNRDCQAKLYEVLVALYEQDILKYSPPLQLTLNILNNGINSKDRHIVLTCEQGLTLLEKLCQPICPSLNLAEIRVPTEAEPSIDIEISNNESENYENRKAYSEDEAANEVESEEKDEYVATDASTVSSSIQDVDVEEEQALNETLEVHGENLEVQIEANNDNNIRQPSLSEQSVHIVDIQIVKPSDKDLQPSTKINNKLENISDINEQNIGAEGNFDSEGNLVKEEALKNFVSSDSTISITLKRELTCSSDDTNLKIPCEAETVCSSTDEPPTKKVRGEDTLNVTEKSVKEELNSTEEIIVDTEEDGNFVDEVKEY